MVHTGSTSSLGLVLCTPCTPEVFTHGVQGVQARPTAPCRADGHIERQHRPGLDYAVGPYRCVVALDTFESNGSGYTVNLMVGKGWWVSDQWGIGAAGQFYTMSVPDDDTELSARAFGLLLSATYN
ncbi:MAG: hypothetical protein AAFX99_27560 [Myxococcota bacterium]